MGSACGCGSTQVVGSPTPPVQGRGIDWDVENSRSLLVRPRHAIFRSWNDVLEAKKKFLCLPPQSITVNNKCIVIHHNPHKSKEHTNIMSRCLTREIFERLHPRATANGVSLDKCILTGIENPGHPTIQTVGLVAGDYHSYNVFRDLFDPVIAACHPGYVPGMTHPTDLDPAKCTDLPNIDAKYVISTRIRSSRNIKRLPFAPSCTLEERRQVESLAVRALDSLVGELTGEYFPLVGSQSYPGKPDGMSPMQGEQLQRDHFLFGEPRCSRLISSGTARDWPDARGVFHNKNKNLLVWINEEDHIRIISMQKGGDMNAVFARFVEVAGTIENYLNAEGDEYAHTPQLGYILTCPSNLGTGLRASMMVKLPLLGAHRDFKSICDDLGLEPRGSGGTGGKFEGVFDISNKHRLGKSEVVLVSATVKGVAALIALEKKLEQGEDVELTSCTNAEDNACISPSVA